MFLSPSWAGMRNRKQEGAANATRKVFPLNGKSQPAAAAILSIAYRPALHSMMINFITLEPLRMTPVMAVDLTISPILTNASFLAL